MSITKPFPENFQDIKKSKKETPFSQTENTRHRPACGIDMPYRLIDHRRLGGSACDIQMEQAGLDFRATKDLKIYGVRVKCQSRLALWRIP